MSLLRGASPILVALVLAVGCGSSSDAASGEGGDTTTSVAAVTSSTVTAEPAVTEPPASTTDAPTTTASPTTTAPCGSGGDLARPSQARTFTTNDGVERTWLLALPSGYDESQPADVVFNLHGAGSNGAEQYVYGNFIAQAEADGVILVMPEALEVNGRPAWNPGDVGSGDDLDFLAELVDLLRAEYCTGAFFAAGMSSGGFMTSALACWTDGPFQGFGPVTLAFHADDACGEAPPRPIVYFHGTDDDTVPFDGNEENGLDAAPVTAQEWADHNGCDPDPVEERISEEVVHFSWQGCEASTDFYVIEGGGHSWPGALAVESLGYVTDDISASDLIWETFYG